MKHRLLIELDAILDTRLACLAIVNPSTAKKLVKDAKYYDRVSDEFHLLDETLDILAYRKLYSSRTADVLPGSRPTALNLLLTEHIRDLEMRLNRKDPDITSLAIDINIHPYQLTDEELYVMIPAIKELLGITVTCEYVKIPPDKLTTEFIRDNNWSVIYLYNFMEWDEAYLSKLTHPPKGVPGVTMFIPELVKQVSDLDTDATIMPNTGRRLKPYNALSILLSETINIEPLDAKLFSIVQL